MKTQNSFWGGYIGKAISFVGKEVKAVFVGPVGGDDEVENVHIESETRNFVDNGEKTTEKKTTVKQLFSATSPMHRTAAMIAILGTAAWAYVGGAVLWYKLYGPAVIFQWPVLFTSSILTPQVLVMAACILVLGLFATFVMMSSRARAGRKHVILETSKEIKDSAVLVTPTGRSVVGERAPGTEALAN